MKRNIILLCYSKVILCRDVHVRQLAEDAVFETDGDVPHALLSRQAAILLRSSSIYIAEPCTQLEALCGPLFATRTLLQAFPQGLRVLTVTPTLRIVSTYYCYNGFNDKRLRIACYSMCMFTDVSINYASFTQTIITHLNLRIVQHL